jgi:hypothetical protein
MYGFYLPAMAKLRSMLSLGIQCQGGDDFCRDTGIIFFAACDGENRVEPGIIKRDVLLLGKAREINVESRGTCGSRAII